MSFKKPFRSAPVVLGSFQRQRRRNVERKTAVRLIGIAAVTGVAIGIGSVAFDNDGRARLASVAKPIAVEAGLARARAPRAGDVWARCDDARAAGSAPIYSTEPGYREGMDGDGDGIACEPYR